MLKGIHGFGGDTLEWGNVLSGSLALFDLPFSAIGDTVLLPYDVRATMNGRWEQPDADKPSAEN